MTQFNEASLLAGTCGFVAEDRAWVSGLEFNVSLTWKLLIVIINQIKLLVIKLTVAIALMRGMSGSLIFRSTLY